MSAQRKKQNAAARPARKRTGKRSFGGPALVDMVQQVAVLCLAVFGFLFCLTSSYQLNVLTGRLDLTAVSLIALFTVVYSNKRRELLLLLSFLAALFWVGLHSDAFEQGILVLVEQGLNSLSLHLPDFLQTQIQAYDAEQAIEFTTTGVQVVLFLVALFAGYFVIYHPSMAGLAIATMPLLIPPAFYSLEPDVGPFFSLAAALIMLFIQGNTGRIPQDLTFGKRPDRPAELPANPEYDRIRNLITLFALPLVVLTALLSLVILPQKDYERPASIEELQQKLQSLEIGNWGQKSNDGLTRGNLSDLSAIRFTGDVALKFRTSLKSSFYLREYAGTIFTNDGWENVSDTYYARYASSFDSIAPENLSAAAAVASGAQIQTYTLSILNVDARATSIWVPTGLITTADEISGAEYEQDVALRFASASDEAGYTISAMPRDVGLSAFSLSDNATIKSAYLAAAGAASGLPDASGTDAELVQSAAEAYIDYVFDTYTALPDDTRQAAEQVCSTYGLSLDTEGGRLNLYETCRSLYNFLVSQCTYSYSPPDIPEGADFVTYFLEESRQGYCVHFATSAAVLLRTLGIPARYAEGYIVVGSDYEKQPDDEGYIDIEDTHAHAWVEVFDPAQLAWIPVEMTASASGTSSTTPDSGDTGDETTAETPSPEPTATPTPEPTEEPTEEPTPEPSADTTPSASSDAGDEETTDADEGATPTPDEENTGDDASSGITPTPDPSATGDSGGEGGAGQGGADASASLRLWPLLVLLSVAGLFGGAFGWRNAKIKRMKRQFYQKNVNAAVIAVCRFTLDMLRFAGCEPIQPLHTAEEYATLAAKRLPWIDRERLRAVLALAQRARFSGKSCTRQDWSEVAAFAAAVHSAVSAHLKRARRLLFGWKYPSLKELS